MGEWRYGSTIIIIVEKKRKKREGENKKGKKGTCLLMYVAIPGERYVIKICDQERYVINKYV